MCSVGISHEEKLIFCKELNEGFTHAENLHLFIQEGLNESGIKSTQLSAIGVSKGPGSYTGLRIGVSSAKGLAYALNIPLISVSTLQLMAAGAIAQQKEEAIYCPLIDARRMEVYSAVYNGADLSPLSEIEALIVDEQSIQKFKDYPKIFFFGDGMPKCRSALSQLGNAHFIESIYPSARHMVNLIYSRFQDRNLEDTAYFEPFYLKDFIAGKKKKEK